MIKDDTVFLRHILDAINKIQEYTKGMDYEGFRTSSLVQDGVIRQLEIIGEATKNLSQTIAKVDKETETLEGVRLLQQGAERRIERIIAKVWGA